MAGALLLLENSTRNIQALGPAWKRQVDDAVEGLRRIRAGEELVEGVELSDAALTEAEFKQLVTAVGGEIRANLGKIEEALETFAADTAQVAELEPVPQHLSQIQGALQILGQERAAEIVATTQHYVQDICDRHLAPDSAVLDALAVAVGSIGAYIEGLERDRPQLESILAPARKDLAAALTGKRPHSGNPADLVAGIEKSFGAWLADHGDRAALAGLTQDLRDVAWLADSQNHERIGKLCAQIIELLELVDSGEVSDDVEATLRQSHDALATLARSQLKSQQLARSAPRVSSLAKAEAVVAPVVGAGVVRGVARSRRRGRGRRHHADLHRRRARDDRAHRKDLARLACRPGQPRCAARPAARVSHPQGQRPHGRRRRDLGVRLGGGEHAQPGTRGQDRALRHDVRAVVQGARGAAGDGGPARGRSGPAGRYPGAARDRRCDRRRPAGRFRRSGRGQRGRRHPDGARAGRGRGAALDPAADELPQLDATLLQIFSNEVRGHIANVRAEVASCRDAGLGGHVAPSLIRAVHTLQGTARALGLKPMAEANAETERLLHTLQTHEASLTDADYAHLDHLTAVVEQLIDALNRGERSVPALAREFADIAHTAHQAIGHHGEEAAVHASPAAAAPATAKPAARPPAAPAPRAAPPPARVPAPPVRTRPASAVAAGDDIVRDTLDPELTEIFLEEAVDILSSIEESLTQWRGNRSDKAAVAELKRQLHTLKGGARMSGAATMGNLSHQTESLLGEIEINRVSADSEIMDLMDEVHDALVTMVERMHGGAPVPAFTQVTNKVLARLGQPLIPVRAGGSSRASVAASAFGGTAAGHRAARRRVGAARPGADRRRPGPGRRRRACAARRPPSRRRPAPRTGRGAGTGRRRRPPRPDPGAHQPAQRAGELGRRGVDRPCPHGAADLRPARQPRGAEPQYARASATRSARLEIQSESQMLARAQTEASLAGEEFDPLELDRFSRLQTLSRSLAESLHDLFTIRGNLENYASQAETVLQQQARINTELQEGLMRTRMVRLRHPGGAPAPHRAPDVARGRQAASSSIWSAPRWKSTAPCSSASSARSSTCCATPSTTASSRTAERRRAGKPADRPDHDQPRPTRVARS
ncbi:MAG: Hpt domain-containing protein [Chromatiales bacterium]|nr:Hpt domain-containing protein [Chromatiales bacterium]